MSDLIVFVVLVGAVVGVGIAIGMIVAGRIDRLLTPPAAEPPMTEEDQP